MNTILLVMVSLAFVFAGWHQLVWDPAAGGRYRRPSY